jgi:Mg2+-importing ATPase
VGLPTKHVLLGADVARLSDANLADVVERTTVFARLSPTDKERVIRSLQARGHVVGFLGDGINDAAALRAADVGISVDTAVDVAKESADIILLQKSLLILEEGVLEGRKVFSNVLKYIRMGASSNFGNMFSVIGASALLPFVPTICCTTSRRCRFRPTTWTQSKSHGRDRGTSGRFAGSFWGSARSAQSSITPRTP